MKRGSNCAFSLVEVTLAIGIAAFCLIAVFGLMPVGVQTNRNANSQTSATNIIAAVAADLRATAKTNLTSTTSARFTISIPTDPTSPSDQPPCSEAQTRQTRYVSSDGQVVTSDARYRVTVTFLRNSAATPTAGATFADLRVTWPAAVDPCTTAPSGSVEAFAALDRH
jgi:type II secretory pathway pseudopilin PulG